MTNTMTKFVVNASVPMLYLKSPSDEQLDAVLAWMADRNLDLVTCLEGEAIFTKSGRGKPAPAIAIQFKSEVDPEAASKMAELYPAPKRLVIKITDHEVVDPISDMPLAPVQTVEAESADLRDSQLEQARHAINVEGPMPSVLAAASADEVPF